MDTEDLIIVEAEEPPTEEPSAGEPATEELPMEEAPAEELSRSFPRVSTPLAIKKRGRGRPPTSGKFQGYLKLRAAADEAKRRALDLAAEEEVFRTGIAAKCRLIKACRSEKRKKTGDGTTEAVLASHKDEAGTAALSVETLEADAKIATDAVYKVATTSGHLKGTFIKELKTAAEITKNIVSELGRRVTLTGDVSYLEAENARQRVEIEDLNS